MLFYSTYPEKGSFADMTTTRLLGTPASKLGKVPLSAPSTPASKVEKLPTSAPCTPASKLDRIPISTPGGPRAKEEKIFVTVRLRPLSRKEQAAKDQVAWECANDHTIVFKTSSNDRANSTASYTFGIVLSLSFFASNYRCSCHEFLDAISFMILEKMHFYGTLLFLLLVSQTKYLLHLV